MNDRMRDSMTEATRLIREGHLLDATTLIQGALGLPATQGSAEAAHAGTPDVTVRPAPQTTRPHILPLSGHAASDDVPSEADATTRTAETGGTFLTGSCTCSAGTRSYRLYVPSGYRGQEISLIVLLHGCTQDAPDLARGTRMNEFAETKTFLVLYPEQSSGANNQRCWNWFNATDRGGKGGEPAIIAAMTRQVMASYSVDPDRVYIAGMSAGGAMAAKMAQTHPELYAAVGIHSGLPAGAAHDLPSAFAAMNGGAQRHAPPPLLPTIIFHGRVDRTVHPSNAEKLLGPMGELTPGTTAAGRMPGGHAYTRTVYRTTGSGVDIEKWIVEGAGHAWSGGSRAGSFTDERGPDASAQMVRFFREHPRRH